MRSKEEIERAHVLQMLVRIERPFVVVGNLEPPAPDVGVQYADQSIEIFEVTELHPDEGPRRGSPGRAHGEFDQDAVSRRLDFGLQFLLESARMIHGSFKVPASDIYELASSLDHERAAQQASGTNT